MALAAGPFAAEAQQFVCWPIAHGDTASGLALRLTGDAAARHTPWFQIRDPVHDRFIAKSRYARLDAGWQACVARGIVDPAPDARAARGGPTATAAADARVGWHVGVAVSVMLFACTLVVRYATAHPVPPDLQRAGEQFVNAFARPLVDPSSDVAPIRARLRFVRQKQQLEICIAPGDGRRYPNLRDHRKNVEYDVHRVVQLLGSRIAVSEQLRAEGKWVIVPIRQADRTQAGVQ